MVYVFFDVTFGAREDPSAELRDVFHVDHAELALAEILIEPALGHHGRDERQEILHEEVRLDHGPGDARGHELAVGERVQAVVPGRRIVGRPDRREPHHVLHLRLTRAAQVAFMLFSGERGPKAVSSQSRSTPSNAGGRLRASSRSPMNGVTPAHEAVLPSSPLRRERAESKAGDRRQETHEVTADATGGAEDQDRGHGRIPSCEAPLAPSGRSLPPGAVLDNHLSMK